MFRSFGASRALFPGMTQERAIETNPGLSPIQITAGEGMEPAFSQDHLLDAFHRASRSYMFRRSKRMVDGLSFLVQAAISGKVLDQASVAAGVFDKGHFDATADPGVRVLVSRLRDRLAEYYATAGLNDPWRLVLQARGYNISVQRNEYANGNADLALVEPIAAVDATPRPCSLAVLPFANLTNNAEHDAICHGIADELISGLTAWKGVDVVSRGASSQFANSAVDVRDVGRELGVSMAIEGSVRMENERTRVTVQLSSTESGFSVWSDNMEHENGDLLEMEKGVAKEILDKLERVLEELSPACK
jgi:TolB-like protein